MRTIALSAVVAVLSVAMPAVACVNGMRHERSQNANDLYAQAQKSLETGRYADASAMAEEGLRGKADANTRSALLRLHGLANLKLGRFTTANDSFGALLKTSKEPFVRGKLCESKLRDAERKGRLDAAAKETLEQLVNDDLFNDPDGFVALARARARAGDLEGAKTAVRSALLAQPEHPEATQLGKELDAAKPPEAQPLKATTKS